MDKYGNTTTLVFMNEIANMRKMRKQILSHAIVCGYENVLLSGNDLRIPGLTPMNPFSMRNGHHGCDIVLLQDFRTTRSDTITKVETVFDLTDWWICLHSGQI